MKLRLVKQIYWVDFRDPGGKRRRLSTGVAVSDSEPKAAEARAYKRAAEIVSEYVAAGPAPVKPVVIVPTLGHLLQTHYDDHWQHMECAKTMRYTVGKLIREVGHVPCTNAGDAWWRTEKARWLKAGLSVATINRYGTTLMSALGIAKDQKHLTEVPTFSAGSEKKYIRERYMHDDEEPRILQWLTDMQRDDIKERRWEWEYLHNMCVFLIDTGFRFSEAYEFRLVDGMADLDAAVSKNGRGRRIPLTARALRAAEFLLGHPHHAWLRENTTKLKPKTAWDWCSHRLDRCLRALEINTKKTPRRLRLTMHCFRHTCASRLLARGINLVVVSKWLGHSHINMTMRYLKLEKNAFTDAMAALDVVSEPRVVTAPAPAPASHPLPVRPSSVLHADEVSS